jgi:hypothetical protein
MSIEIAVNATSDPPGKSQEESYGRRFHTARIDRCRAWEGDVHRLVLLAGIAVLLAFIGPRAHADNLDGANPDGDVVLGSDTAPVTIIEYASMTSPSSAHFALTTFPELRQRYIDTGKLRFVFREFPGDILSMAAAMLARCAGKDKYMAITEALFAKRADWIVKSPLEPLKAVVKPFGFTDDSFSQCLSNQKTLDGIKAVVAYATNELHINAPPAFLIDGKDVRGSDGKPANGRVILLHDEPFDRLAQAIDPTYTPDGPSDSCTAWNKDYSAGQTISGDVPYLVAGGGQDENDLQHTWNIGDEIRGTMEVVKPGDCAVELRAWRSAAGLQLDSILKGQGSFAYRIIDMDTLVTGELRGDSGISCKPAPVIRFTSSCIPARR